jgi:hypothetical protein
MAETIEQFIEALKMARGCAIQLEQEHRITSGAYGSVAANRVIGMLIEIKKDGHSWPSLRKEILDFLGLEANNEN